MAGITGLGTTFNLPNFPGELIAITPTDTPLLSMAGGIGGGKQTDDTAFGWQEYDLRAPESRPRLEGADAPAAEARKRANIENVVQIFHEQVATSYTKQAAVGKVDANNSGLGTGNPVQNEHDWQVTQALTQIARDVNYTFWHSTKVKPSDNSTPRQTAGLLSVISSNVKGTAPTSALTTGAANIINEVGTPLANGDKVVFTAPPAELRKDRVYYVVSKATDSFKVALTSGGAAITIATGQTGIAYVKAATALTPAAINGLLQSVFDNGGISQQGTATLFVPSIQKVAITEAYVAAGAKTSLVGPSRTVGGVAVDTLITDFGTLNVSIDRALPPDAITVVSAEQVEPVFLNIPGKGVLFEEELAKTGASDKSQIYGEIGLKYGNERAHGVIRGLAA